MNVFLQNSGYFERYHSYKLHFIRKFSASALLWYMERRPRMCPLCSSEVVTGLINRFTYLQLKHLDGGKRFKNSYVFFFHHIFRKHIHWHLKSYLRVKDNKCPVCHSVHQIIAENEYVNNNLKVLSIWNISDT